MEGNRRINYLLPMTFVCTLYSVSNKYSSQDLDKKKKSIVGDEELVDKQLITIDRYDVVF